MGKIFISYRRQDSADVAGRIYDKLGDEFERHDIFMDVDDVPLGVDFRHFLRDAIIQCKAMLVIIGDRWLTLTNHLGTRRLDVPNDWVRTEIEIAMERKDIPIIPVLVLGAVMPRAHELPESICDLAYRNAIQIRPNPDFHRDMDRLIAALRASLVSAPTGVVPSSQGDVEENAEGLVRRGQLLLIQLKHREASLLFRHATEAEPSNFDAWAWLYQSLVGRDDVKAFAALEHAAEIRPNDWSVWKSMASLLERLDRHEEAVEAYKHALDLRPDDGSAWRSMGDALAVMGDFKGARDAFSKAVELNPYDVLASRGREAMEERMAHIAPTVGDKQERGSVATAIATLDVDQSGAEVEWDFGADNYVAMGDSLKRIGKYDAAAKAYEAGIQRGHASATVWGNLGYCYNKLRGWQAAMRAHDQALALNDDLAWVWSNRADALYGLGRYEEAAASYKRGLTISSNANRWKDLARVLRMLGRDTEADEAEQHAIDHLL